MTSSPVVDTAESDALQAALAGEHAAAWVLALLGARTSESAQPGLYDAIRSAYAWHTATRDDLTATIAGLGLVPVAAAAAYQPPAGLDTAAGVSAAALALERACARTFTALVAATTGERRAQAGRWLTETAVRELTFGGAPEAFPGYDPAPDAGGGGAGTTPGSSPSPGPSSP